MHECITACITQKVLPHQVALAQSHPCAVLCTSSVRFASERRPVLPIAEHHHFCPALHLFSLCWHECDTVYFQICLVCLCPVCLSSLPFQSAPWSPSDITPHADTFCSCCHLLSGSVCSDCYIVQQVHVVASMPCYSPTNVDQQRGHGVFDRSIKGLQALNAVGYGQLGTGLQLDLVYNPNGIFLAPPQSKLEVRFSRP